jgi:hypothetical protein
VTPDSRSFSPEVDDEPIAMSLNPWMNHLTCRKLMPRRPRLFP